MDINIKVVSGIAILAIILGIAICEFVIPYPKDSPNSQPKTVQCK